MGSEAGPSLSGITIAGLLHRQAASPDQIWLYAGALRLF